MVVEYGKKIIYVIDKFKLTLDTRKNEKRKVVFTGDWLGIQIVLQLPLEEKIIESLKGDIVISTEKKVRNHISQLQVPATTKEGIGAIIFIGTEKYVSEIKIANQMFLHDDFMFNHVLLSYVRSAMLNVVGTLFDKEFNS